MTIGSSIRSHNQSLHVVDSIPIASHVNGVGMFSRQRCGEISQLLGQTYHFVGVCGLVGTVGSIVVLDLIVLVPHIDVVKLEIL